MKTNYGGAYYDLRHMDGIEVGHDKPRKAKDGDHSRPITICVDDPNLRLSFSVDCARKIAALLLQTAASYHVAQAKLAEPSVDNGTALRDYETIERCNDHNQAWVVVDGKGDGCSDCWNEVPAKTVVDREQVDQTSATIGAAQLAAAEAAD